MKMKISSFILAGLIILTSCGRTEDITGTDQSGILKAAGTGGTVKAGKNLTGDPADVSPATSGGLCLMGGSTDVDAAFRWMINNSGGGDFVVIRTDNSMGYNDYIYNMGGVNSVETVIIAKATDANSTTVENKIRNAEALFIAGGDQANYVKLWKNTKVENAINYLINDKKAPVGGTSAGCAILSTTYFAALNGTVTSDAAMANPYDPLVSLGHDDFLNSPFLRNTITDQHFSQRGRQGRLVTFMARMYKDWVINPKGIGVDEQTAVCVDNVGMATVFGLNSAFFLQMGQSGPESCKAGVPLHWYVGGHAVNVYKVQGSSSGNNSFDLSKFIPVTGGTTSYFYVNNGVFGTSL
jgi:cyanophycinase